MIEFSSMKKGSSAWFYVWTLRVEEFTVALLAGAIGCMAAGMLLPIDPTGSLNGGRVLGTYAPLIVVVTVGILFSSPWGENFHIASTGRDLRIYQGCASVCAGLANLVVFAALVLVGAELSIATASFWIGWLALGLFYLLSVILPHKRAMLFSALFIAVLLSSPVFNGPNQFTGNNVADGISLCAKVTYSVIFVIGLTTRFLIDAGDRHWIRWAASA